MLALLLGSCVTVSERLNLAGLQPPLQESTTSPPCRVCPEVGVRCAQHKAAWHTGCVLLATALLPGGSD